MAARDRSRLRPAFVPVPRPGQPVHSSAGLVLDAARGTAVWHGEPLGLTARELALLELLARHPGRLITGEELSEHAWSELLVSRHTVASTVKRIRARLREAGFDAEALVTVRGLGYRWDDRIDADREQEWSRAG